MYVCMYVCMYVGRYVAMYVGVYVVGRYVEGKVKLNDAIIALFIISQSHLLARWLLREKRI